MFILISKQNNFNCIFLIGRLNNVSLISDYNATQEHIVISFILMIKSMQAFILII